MSMDLKLIRNLVRLMERGEVSELEIDDEKLGLRVHLKRGQQVPAGGQPVMMMPGSGAALEDRSGEASSGEASSGLPAGVEEMLSPMVGTFYRAASPDADPFTSVGQAVEDSSVICIIEAMKVMNEIKAELSGEVVDILVENGEPVEYGQPLFLIKTR